VKYYCPQCSKEVDPLAEGCKHCPARFREGGWRPVSESEMRASAQRTHRITVSIAAALLGGPILGMLAAEAAGMQGLAFVLGWSMLVTIPIGLVFVAVAGMSSRPKGGW
jgi:hypothetical protein